MTREEAIKFAENAVNLTDIPDVKEFYRMSAAALRHITREQVEKMRVSRVRELEELYAELHAVTGFTAEQLLGMFAEGYTLEKPDRSKHFETMANMAERIQRELAREGHPDCGAKMEGRG